MNQNCIYEESSSKIFVWGECFIGNSLIECSLSLLFVVAHAVNHHSEEPGGENGLFEIGTKKVTNAWGWKE